MRQRGFAPVLVSILILVVGIMGYLLFRSSKSSQLINTVTQTSTLSPVEVSNVVIPDIVTQWTPQVSWQKPVTGSFQLGWMDKPAYGTKIEGTISISDPNPYGIVPLIQDKILNLGWQHKIPIGATGPMSWMETYSGIKNGSPKTLVVDVEMLDDINKVLPSYRNSISIFQEQ